ncbi:hypothetical protein HQN87_08255 [Paenibacillus tritici]|uniref:Uncharacterized protein n=1 Tax=Paenibacillus tritici TaxID=1873425 RepID=A0ABX2DL37_9BACL|nr:hypothetical protein [Paenibacillus tritici]NQX45322.1 hypothetical protein [Paenibacillus tritici]
MIIPYRMNLGSDEGDAEIEDSELIGLTEEEIKERIYQAIWEDAKQYLDAWPVKEADSDET